MQVVPRQATPLGLQAIPGLVEAAFAALGTRITGVQRVNLAALVAIETARGRSVQNGNLGNITARADYSGMVWRPPWFEINATSSPRDVQLHAAMLAGKAPSAFRAYASAEEGARDFARFLLKPQYAPLLRAATSTDVDAFRRALAERYSADYKNPDATRTLTQLVHELGGTTSRNVAGSLLVVAALVVLVSAYARTGARSRHRGHRSEQRARVRRTRLAQTTH